MDLLTSKAVRRELSLFSMTRPRRRMFLLVWSCTTWLGAAAPAMSALLPSYGQEVIPGLSVLKVDLTSHPAMVDLDADGDLDAVVGDGAGRLAFFVNSGSSSDPSFVQRTGPHSPFTGIDVGYGATPELVDFDGDSDLDLIVGANDGSLRYFANTGSAQVPSFVPRTGSANPFSGINVGANASPALADLDADGDWDLAVGERFAGVLYFENTGSPGAPAFVPRTGSSSPFSSVNTSGYYFLTPTLFDADDDGDFDLIAGHGGGGPIFLAVNIGNASAPSFVGPGTPPLWMEIGDMSSVAMADLDGDGDRDAVIGEYDGDLLFAVNSGSAASPFFVKVTGSGNPFGAAYSGDSSTPEVADVDGDGDLDALVGMDDGRLAVLRNTGGSAAPRFVREVTGHTFEGIDVGTDSSPSLADLDGDGDLDLAVGGYDGVLHYFANLSRPSAPAFFEQFGSANPFNGISVGPGVKPEFFDLDGDGDFDCAVGRRDGGLVYLENTGTVAAPAFFSRTGTSNPFALVTGNPTDPGLADLDGDGDPDLVVGTGPPVGTRYYRNLGPGANPQFLEASGSANPFSAQFAGARTAPDLFDFDGDGDFDVLVGNRAGLLVFLRASSPLFADGFESGNTAAWGAAAGGG